MENIFKNISSTFGVFKPCLGYVWYLTTILPAMASWAWRSYSSTSDEFPDDWTTTVLRAGDMYVDADRIDNGIIRPVFTGIMMVFLLFLSCPPISAQSKQIEMDAFINDLMERMTVSEKIGQINLEGSWDFRSNLNTGNKDRNLDLLKQGRIGGFLGFKNHDDISYIQHLAVDSTRLGIPLLFGLDVIHGFETIFPIPIALACSWDTDMIEQCARISAREATAQGVNWTYSPMVDICRDARWGRIAEGAGEDPFLGGEIAKAYVYGYQGRDSDLSDPTNMMACVKHYALYGAADAGRDYNTVSMDRQTMHNGYLRPYHEAVKAGVGSVMTSFNEVEGIPATCNEYLLDGVLRSQWGFDGFVVTDATAIAEMVNHGLGNLQECSARALQAGNDMDMASDGYLNTIEKSLAEGRVSEADIDRCCRRILEAKYKLGLFDDPYRYVSGDRMEEIFSDANREFSRKVAANCQVLLKNEDNILPLNKDIKIALVGPLANNHTDMHGSWAFSSHTDESVTILEGLQNAFGSENIKYAEGSWLMCDSLLEHKLSIDLIGFLSDERKAKRIHERPLEELIAEAVDVSRDCDVIIAALGENSTMNGEGSSRSDISIPDAQRQLLEALHATGKPVVLVLTTGRPLTLKWESENLPAILCTWSLGSQAGDAIADVLSGKVNPSGKLTASFPRSVGQLPMSYNHKNTGRPHPDHAPFRRFTSCYMDEINAPLYPFGYGLSYTEFTYGEPRLSTSEIDTDGSATLTVAVTNSGQREGTEIVQMYIHDVAASSTRPVKELKGFQRVSLQPGETAVVSFDIDAETLKFFNHELEYVLEPGLFEIMVGPDSERVSKVELNVR